MLAGHVPDELRTPHPRFGRARWEERLAGRAVEAVEAHGKHLFLRFEGGLTIHSHLRMSGSWRVLDRGARWPRSPRAAWLYARRGDREVVQFNGPVLELMTASRSRFDRRLAQLGPDILAPEFDEARFLRRLREDDPTRPIGDALLDQRTIAGIGNLWKVEGCFSARHRPVAADRRGRRRRGARDHRGHPPAHAALGPGRQPDPLQADLRQAGLPCPRCGGDDPGPRAVGRQPPDLLVPVVSGVTVRRVGHKGADHIAPGNTLASFDAALAARVDMIEFDVLPEDPRRPGREPAGARARPRAPRARRADARSRARPPRRGRVRGRGARRRPQAARLRGAGAGGAARARPGGADAGLHAVHAQPGRRCASSSPRCGSAGRCRGSSATTRASWVTKVPAYGLLLNARRRLPRVAAAHVARRPLRRADGPSPAGHAAAGRARCATRAATSTCGRSTTPRRSGAWRGSA